MRIVIVGCGKVGQSLCRDLSAEGHEITVIDPAEHKVEALVAECDVLGFVGSGVDLDVIQEADISDCDLFLAMTHSDETNLLCCLIAKRFSNCQTIARVRSPEITATLPYLASQLNLSMIVNPERAAAAAIARVLRFPSVIAVDSFSNRLAEILTFKIRGKSILDGMFIYDLPSKLKCDVLVAVVHRKGQTIIPTGNFRLETGDQISIVGSGPETAKFVERIGLNPYPVRSLIIIGGSLLAYYLVENLKKDKMEITVIDHDQKKCELLSSTLPHATIVYGDALDESLLAEEGLETVDAIASLTGLDEENIMLSLYAKTQNDHVKTITKVNKIRFDDVLEALDLETIINPKEIAAEAVLRHVRSMDLNQASSVQSVYRLSGEQAEAIEFQVLSDSAITNVPLADLTFKQGVLIGAILRHGTYILPRGSDEIHVGDKVIAITNLKGIHDLSELVGGKKR